MTDRNTPADYPKSIGEMWACFNAYRKLGFSADDIYFAPVGDKIGVVLKRGELHHGVACGKAHEGWQEDCLAFFQDVKEGQAGIKPGFAFEALDKLYVGSAVYAGASAMVETLIEKGLIPPNCMD